METIAHILSSFDIFSVLFRSIVHSFPALEHSFRKFFGMILNALHISTGHTLFIFIGATLILGGAALLSYLHRPAKKNIKITGK